jgi:hypothetical protein
MAALKGRSLPGFCTISLEALLCITSGYGGSRNLA